ncbi:proton channel OTOP2 [Ambystoma mexicanum]|uniref:proton channel OTOP2 n=1 Tax=Ambystoma mexicanum TaxID=8296 RepID=UPI0037E7B7EE
MSEDPVTRKGSAGEGGHEVRSRIEKMALGCSDGHSEGPGVHHSVFSGTVEAWKKGGRLFSALLTINLLLLGCALVSSGAFGEVAVQEVEVLAFLITLMILSSAWMLFYLLFTAKHHIGDVSKDSHAGPIWLRGGLALFGVCTLVLDVFKIGHYIGYISCESPIKILFPVVQAVFAIIQTYFLWVSAKDCVQVDLNISRFGLMLTLTTNLGVWMAAVTDESIHQSDQFETDSSALAYIMGIITLVFTFPSTAGGGAGNNCVCTTDICDIFQTGYYYLYPFNIEYSLFASAMTYVMWKNVGRFMDHHPDHPKMHLSLRTLFVGLTMGVCLVVAGLGIFIVYEVQVNSNAKEDTLAMFYIFNIVGLTLMSLGALGGSILYRFDDRLMDNHKNPTRTLDVVLLLGAALGPCCISYYSIVAMVAINPRDLLSILNLVYSLLIIIQHTFQNTFIIEGLHRKPFQELHPQMMGSLHSHREAPPELTYANHGISQDMHNGTPSVISEAHGQEVAASQAEPRSRVTEHHLVIQSRMGSWRRSFLREISLFLLLSNIIFWIIPAFGGRPQFDHDKEMMFYGDTIWIAIVNICLPFGIFYRMHAVASLVEVFIMS